MSEKISKYELRALLADQAPNAVLVVSVRSAFRSAPKCLLIARTNPNGNLLFLASVRALIVSVASTAFPSDLNLRSAARSASIYPLSITISVSAPTRSSFSACISLAEFAAYPDKSGLAHAVLDSAASGFSIESEYESPLYTEAKYELENIEDQSPCNVFSIPLWSDNHQKAASGLIFTEINELNLADERSFWRDWYQGFFDGKPLDWELQRRVALIPDDDWEKGPAHIAEIIEKIRLEFRTNVSTRLERDEKQSKFVLEAADTLADDILAFSCDRIGSALQNALASSGENGLREDSYETITIRRALDHHFGRASMLATGFFDACLSLQKTIGDRYPDDAALINLQNALYAVVEEINEQHKEARARCARLATLARPEPITRDDREEIALVPVELAGELDSEAIVILKSDVGTILAQDNPPKSVRARFTNWVTTISQWMDKAMKGDKRARWLAGLVSRLVRWWSGGDGSGDDPE